MSGRYDHTGLIRFCRDALTAAGLDPNHAGVVAETLVEGDLLGHSTHGLALLPRYLEEIVAGGMTRAGEPTVINDNGISVAWDGRYLPGPVLVRRALELCAERAREHGVATAAIGRSHHVACLAAYLMAATDRGLAAIVASSSPNNASVAPFGAVEGAYSPNPLAAGWPTGGDPVLIDVSTSITTSSLTSEVAAAGGRLPGAWVIGADGEPVDDPAVLTASPPGALLPLGGTDHGHKGFALGMLVEMLTSGLAGHGRAERPSRWGASVFIMVIDPEHHGGKEAFERQTGNLAAACRAARPLPGGPPVRLPGQRALELRRTALVEGVALPRPLVDRLRERSTVVFPDPQ
ncbi:Ldh family oxidoreductase [Aurantimonas marianensis]|uniref:Ldh family oxidoreductase n=1 Tax=Aurantimonas marianensis TaxID=2920428 RepID=A0A9X2H764_9HYPH|nr:Ldh family oxidoreductase [Aurantimonas marianensis]MCP3055491.1 Ldh family oxidoreductase [Aurantimonas marianensis]